MLINFSKTNDSNYVESLADFHFLWISMDVIRVGKNHDFLKIFIKSDFLNLNQIFFI